MGFTRSTGRTNSGAQGFCSAGVPPAVLQIFNARPRAGETPALRSARVLRRTRPGPRSGHREFLDNEGWRRVVFRVMVPQESGHAILFGVVVSGLCTGEFGGINRS